MRKILRLKSGCNIADIKPSEKTGADIIIDQHGYVVMDRDLGYYAAPRVATSQELNQAIMVGEKY